MAIMLFILSIGITYLVILTAVKAAIEDSKVYIKDAVAEGILEALALRDARKNADRIEQ